MILIFIVVLVTNYTHKLVQTTTDIIIIGTTISVIRQDRVGHVRVNVTAKIVSD